MVIYFGVQRFSNFARVMTIEAPFMEASCKPGTNCVDNLIGLKVLPVGKTSGVRTFEFEFFKNTVPH